LSFLFAILGDVFPCESIAVLAPESAEELERSAPPWPFAIRASSIGLRGRDVQDAPKFALLLVLHRRWIRNDARTNQVMQTQIGDVYAAALRRIQELFALAAQPIAGSSTHQRSSAHSIASSSSRPCSIGFSRAPHTLLALAEAGQGIAIIPSVLRTDRYKLKVARVTHRRRPLRDRYVIQWDKRRPIPSFAQDFCAALAAYMRDLLPITRRS
jgi:DNA-binding transcriptional LysR family regulator